MKKSLFCRVALLVFGASLLLSVQMPNASTPTAASRSALLDINSATPERLLALPGMGRAYAQRIIDGPPEPAYEKIAAQIVAKRIPGL